MNITPDYKNIRLLSQFISPYTGRIYGRHITRLCKHKQELVEKEISKAHDSGNNHCIFIGIINGIALL